MLVSVGNKRKARDPDYVNGIANAGKDKNLPFKKIKTDKAYFDKYQFTKPPT